MASNYGLTAVLHERVKSAIFRDRFWPLYPHKVSKRDAEKAWLKVIRTKADLDVCLANTTQWAQHWAATIEDEKFIPYPATYLRKGQWEDPPPDAAPRQRIAQSTHVSVSQKEINDKIAEYGAEATRTWLKGLGMDTDGLGL